MNIKIIGLIIFFGFYSCLGYAQSVPIVNIDGEIYTYEELETQVQQLLLSGNVDLRRKVELVFTLAKLYEQQGKMEKAKGLYDKALEVNAWNLKYQLNLAHLLSGTERQQEAEEKAQLVSVYAEEEILIKDAEVLLESMGIVVKPANEHLVVDKNVEIVLVPLGEVNLRVLKELQYVLQQLMGINFSIANTKKYIGEFDRDGSSTFVNHAFSRLYDSLLPMQRNIILSELKMNEDSLNSKEDKLKFIYAYLGKFDQEQAVKEKQSFNELLQDVSSRKQYDIARLIKELRQEFLLESNSPIKGYLAVTGQDIYEGDSNFRFGGAFPGYGVLSYHRFKADFNKENQNRPRLIKRALKQATSSAFFILGIPRCSNPLCIRAYPHSLAELEGKGNEICSSCLSKLKKYQNESGR